MTKSAVSHSVPRSQPLFLAAAVVALAVAGIAGATPAVADDGQCFKRTYIKSHLAGHPKQRVVSARLLINYETGVPQPAENMALQLKLRNPSETVETLGRCKSDGEEDLRCFFEGDWGEMHFSATDTGDARVEMIRLDYETDKGFGALNTSKGADDVFIMRPSSRGACDGLDLPN